MSTLSIVCMGLAVRDGIVYCASEIVLRFVRYTINFLQDVCIQSGTILKCSRCPFLTKLRVQYSRFSRMFSLSLPAGAW